MAATPSICFVTNELYPLGPGGIGRMLYNFARHNESLGFPADIHFLIPRALVESRADAQDLLDEALDGIATVHVCPDLGAIPTPLAQLLAKAKDYPWTGEWLYSESYRYFLGLQQAEAKRGRPFDVVEFPDFGGWGVASLEAKRAGLAFSDTLLSVRVHSTQGILYGVERFAYDPGHWAGIMFDAERHLFANADLVVGHDPAIIDYTARAYGLQDRWNGRTVLEFPPVFIRTGPATYVRADQVAVPPTDDAGDFLFGSRLQPVKRPDLFIRAAILFLERHPDHAGTFRLVCGGWDRGFVDGLKSLVPDALAERIRFIEQASADERHHLIGRSIIVVPSDYESLCLFAFEAVLAGRKLILNGANPAFGNGYRWHDRDNVLLFDGSVEGLADTMAAALHWRPTSMVEVAPSRPYWLDPALQERPARVASPASPPIRIFCYGAQSAGEFRRHHDSTLALESALRATGRASEIIVQLPRAIFAPGGPEEQAIRERGWTCLFSSGLRECPQMFGRRVAALGAGPVLLFPYGFEPDPAFVTAAADLFAADPGLSLAGGQIELIDGLTGRSDFLRVYSGEAPSTALLSSRIVPALCFVSTEAVRRHGFDALAGGFWFEVFARTCALAGERIAALPMLAGSLDSAASSRPETSKRVSAGLLDQLGRAAGWQARLLSVDPAEVPGNADGRPTLLDASHLRRAFRIHPVGQVRSWEPVGWHDHAHGVLVHPLEGHTVIGELPGPLRRVSMLTAHVRNMSLKNDGAMVAVGLVRSHVLPRQIVDLLKSGEESDDMALSGWTFVEPNASAQIACPCYGVSKGGDKILLLTRVPEGMRDDNAEIVFTKIDLQFNDTTIG